MKRFLSILFCLSSVCYAQKPPNIVHIIADDIGWDDFSAYGSRNYNTPHIDRLSKGGVLLTNYYAPHSTCTPTRAALLTGRYAPRVNNGTGLGVLFPSDTIGLDPKKETSFTVELKKKGYATALFGKWHLGHLQRFLPPAHGFDEFLGIPYPNDHGPERLGNTGSRRFPPIPLIHNSEKISDLSNTDLAELPGAFIRKTCEFITEKVNRNQPFYVQYSNIETHTPWFVPSGFGGSPQGAYADAVAYFDMCVGILTDHLRKLGIEEETIIVLQSDNGPLVERYEELERCYGKFALVDTLRTHRLRQGKYQDRYEGGQRTPCIVQWKGKIKGGEKVDALIAGVDWFPTLLALAGAEVPGDRLIDGKNILPILTGESTTPVRNTYYAFTPYGGPAAVRFNDWKLVRPLTSADEWELYNLAMDPGERVNLSQTKKDLVQEMKGWMEKAGKSIAGGTPLENQH
jgi:arylsulfatase A-like enzyme